MCLQKVVGRRHMSRPYLQSGTIWSTGNGMRLNLSITGKVERTGCMSCRHAHTGERTMLGPGALQLRNWFCVRHKHTTRNMQRKGQMAFLKASITCISMLTGLLETSDLNYKFKCIKAFPWPELQFENEVNKNEDEPGSKFAALGRKTPHLKINLWW